MVLSLCCGTIFGFLTETDKTYVESGKLYNSFDMTKVNIAQLVHYSVNQQVFVPTAHINSSPEIDHIHCPCQLLLTRKCHTYTHCRSSGDCSLVQVGGQGYRNMPSQWSKAKKNSSVINMHRKIIAELPVTDFIGTWSQVKTLPCADKHHWCISDHD